MPPGEEETRVEVEEPDRSATPSRPAAITLGRG
jgi:hypothetical protein